MKRLLSVLILAAFALAEYIVVQKTSAKGIHTSPPLTPSPVCSPVSCALDHLGGASSAEGAPTASPYPQTADISVVSLGENGAMKGFLPFCPSPSNCSVIYKDIRFEPVATADDAAFHGYSNYDTSNLSPNFDSPAASLPWYWLDTTPGVDGEITYLSTTSRVLPTENDDTVLALKPDMTTEGNGNPNLPWTGDGRDRHLSILDKHTGKANEVYQPQTKSDGTGDVYSNTGWDLLLPIEQQSTGGYTSADAAGMPQIAMAVTYEDLAAGEIKHMLRMTVPHTSCGGYSGNTYGLYASPASHAACNGGGGDVAYMGEVLRLKAATVLPAKCGPQGTVIFNAMKKHGLMITDNGRFGLFQGTYDPRINQSDVACLSALVGSELEVVKPNNAALTAGALNPETLTAGETRAYDQTGRTKANTTDGRTATCSADVTCGLGRLIGNVPAAPTITSFTGSASSVALGSCVTLRLTATNAVKTFVNNAYGVISGNSGTLTACPTQATSYVAKTRGLHGYAYSSPVVVTVTGPTVAEPLIALAAGTYTSAQTVAIQEATPGAALFYSTSGPAGCKSTPYTGPIYISATTTLSAIACKSVMINSAVVSAGYTISIPGSIPQVLGSANSGNYADGATQSATHTFAGGTTAIVATIYNRGAAPSDVACGRVKGVLVRSAVGTGGAVFGVAVYRVPSVPSGSQTCRATYGASVFGAISVTEITGSSGDTDVSTSGKGTKYPKLTCGSLTTTGANRLGLAYGQVEYSTVSASSGYTAIFTAGAFAGASIPLAAPGTTAVTLNTNNGSTDASCVALALKP